MPNRKIMLSPSTLNLYLECPRCFWLDKIKGIKRPRGIFPSLPSGMDLVIKNYFDKYRLKGELPEEIKNKIKGKLFPDMETLKKWGPVFTGPLHFIFQKTSYFYVL